MKQKVASLRTGSGEPSWPELPPVGVYEQDAQRAGRPNGHGETGTTEAAERQARSGPAPIDWSKLEGRDPPPRAWWIQDWLTAAPTLCSGAGGVGKSILRQTIGTSLAMGCEFLGATTSPLRVLMWACEDDEVAIWRRQVNICSHFEIAIADLVGKLTIVPRLGCDNTLLDLVFGRPCFTSTFEILREQVNDLKADLLVLDNVGQVFGGGESDRHQVTVFVNGVHGIVAGRPFAPVLLGHVARSAGSEFSGSAAWENACRCGNRSQPCIGD